MDIAFVLYDEFTALDLIGPYEVLAGPDSVTPHFVAASRDTVVCDSGLPIRPTTTFAELTGPDVVVVPGSSQWRAALERTELTTWLAAVHPTTTWTASVCTGSTLLAKAGILADRPATTHWAVRDVLAELGAQVRTDRVVVDGDVITGAGVSAGIDMALLLAARMWGEDSAKLIQLALEYDPQPPFDSGSPDKAGPELAAAVREGVLPA
ncbi:DJ-1/PfpI family protein [Saccharopolyspora kobensis]|uniref:DJ-1/PfpI family protein n=1 Tax=Saccharopolyspora kobensis TaxID=146035 RepID=A0A1H6EHV3_9PSEU|nr:DJ-1/PfpI family protein [Saccharopolyspora kobensis]SEG96873.1 DJ-1/PfpI family protein [Saccharopolyspora kobensis]SFE64300.1 DJ-1/PfpI family protein [Saccharopolyspora kobensis]